MKYQYDKFDLILNMSNNYIDCKTEIKKVKLEKGDIIDTIFNKIDFIKALDIEYNKILIILPDMENLAMSRYLILQKFKEELNDKYYILIKGEI